MKESFYSAPEEKKRRVEKKLSQIELFIETMKNSLKKQQARLLALNKDMSLSTDEKSNRIKGARSTIQSILNRISEEVSKQDALKQESDRLKKIHEAGLKLLQNTETNLDNAN